MDTNRYMDHLRKLALTEVGRACATVERVALIAAIIIHWTLSFRQTYDERPKEDERQWIFTNAKQAQDFLDHRPTGLFPCINSLTAMPGMCEIKDVRVYQGENNGQQSK
jgi:hypothetical protein